MAVRGHEVALENGGYGKKTKISKQHIVDEHLLSRNLAELRNQKAGTATPVVMRRRSTGEISAALERQISSSSPGISSGAGDPFSTQASPLLDTSFLSAYSRGFSPEKGATSSEELSAAKRRRAKKDLRAAGKGSGSFVSPRVGSEDVAELPEERLQSELSEDVLKHLTALLLIDDPLRRSSDFPRPKCDEILAERLGVLTAQRQAARRAVAAKFLNAEFGG